MMEPQTSPGVDLRESLYNDRRIGPIAQIQLPREAVTRLHGLAIDLDANLLKPNPWFPPAPTAAAFSAAIEPVLNRHPILRHAELRDTGRWLHALVWFREPVELRSAADQQRWAALHRVLMGSVPSDPAAPVLIALTRPLGSTNSKTGATVATIKEGHPIPAALLEEWAQQISRKPFETIGSILFGSSRVSPCPYCRQEGSHLDLGAMVGFCYGACRCVRVARLFEPFFKDPATQEAPIASEQTPAKTTTRRKKKAQEGKNRDGETVITITADTVLEIDPTRVRTITIRVGKKKGEKTS